MFAHFCVQKFYMHEKEAKVKRNRQIRTQTLQWVVRQSELQIPNKLVANIQVVRNLDIVHPGDQ